MTRSCWLGPSAGLRLGGEGSRRRVAVVGKRIDLRQKIVRVAVVQAVLCAEAERCACRRFAIEGAEARRGSAGRDLIMAHGVPSGALGRDPEAAAPNVGVVVDFDGEDVARSGAEPSSHLLIDDVRSEVLILGRRPRNDLVLRNRSGDRPEAERAAESRRQQQVGGITAPHRRDFSLEVARPVVHSRQESPVALPPPSSRNRGTGARQCPDRTVSRIA